MDEKRDELILNNESLIYLMLKRMNLYSEREHYYDVGMVGLVKAANTYNPDRGYAFSTLASVCIQNEILYYIRSNKKHDNTISLDSPVPNQIGEDENKSLIDIIASDFNMEDYLIEKEKIEILNKAISTLEPDEQYLLKHYYSSTTKQSQQELAKMYGTTQPTIARKIKKIIKKLQDIIKYDKEEIWDLVKKKRKPLHM